nr:hypothetical protein [Parasporobacterium sp.]
MSSTAIIGIVIFIAMIVLVLIGVPVFVALLGCSFVGFLLLGGFTMVKAQFVNAPFSLGAN